jgi:hypothetical protein
VVEGVAVGLDLDRQPLRVLGVDPLADRPFRELVGGGSIGTPGFGRFYADPQAVLIGSGMAARYRLTPSVVSRSQNSG